MDMKKMMKEAQKMQRNAALAQERVAAMEFSATAGGGMVSATVTGSGTLKSLEIDPDALDPEDVDILQDTIVAAINDALSEANEKANDQINAAVGNLNLNMPGFM
jgi:nucleoid-associated protein EbfC